METPICCHFKQLSPFFQIPKFHGLDKPHPQAKKIYHCCDNGDGIHWDENFCSWTVGGDEDLELYIDVP